MAFNITQFRAQLQKDGARGNLFEVALPFPTFSDPGASEKLTFMCKAASLPGTQVNPIVVPYFGRELKVPGNRTYAEWDLTIINDEDFRVRTAFELWDNGLNSSRGNLRATAAESSEGYSVDALVRQYGKSNQIIRQYDFIGCFPIAISPIELAWENNDSIEEFSVTLAFQWFESVSLGIV